MTTDAPPPALNWARILAYAVVEPPVTWTGRQRLHVGEHLLGPVPRLAIAQNVGGPLTDILLFHCGEDWTVLGVSGAATMALVKAQAERAYAGISAAWIETDVSREDAEHYIRATYPGSSCSFCHRLATEVGTLVEGKDAFICDRCIVAMRRAIQSPSGDGGG